MGLPKLLLTIVFLVTLILVTQVWGDKEKTAGLVFAHNVMTEKNKVDPMWEIRNQGWKFR